MSSARIKLSNLRRATKTPPPEVDVAWRRLRRGLDDRRAARSRWRLLLVPTVTLAAAAVAAVWYVRRAPETAGEPTIAAGRAFESRASAVALALPDGVHVDMGPHSRVAVEEVTPHQIRVGLGHGDALFDVEPHHQRRFIVDVGGVEVRVVGTRFRVARGADDDGDGARVEVSVERGIVEVASRHGGEIHRLRAGERYSALITAPDEATPPGEPEPATEPADEAGAPTAGPPARRAVAPARAAARPHAAHEEARLLLEQAQGQWRAGQMAAAASSYEEILARYPNDARAGLAALELGRIRMDHLGDLQGAVVSLQRALRLAPSASFREDALARLVRATDRLGRHDECKGARDMYLARYPSGIHASVIEKACE